MPRVRRLLWRLACWTLPWLCVRREITERADQIAARTSARVSDTRRERDELSRRLTDLRASVRARVPLAEVERWPQ